MPELPEVEVVRRGLNSHAVGRRIDDVEVFHQRAVRHSASADAVCRDLRHAEITGTGRRGKYLWLKLSGAPAECLLVHLGMSGQMLIKAGSVGEEDPNARHLRARVRLSDGNQLWFVDQRTFGYWLPGKLIGGVPETVQHVARDPFDPGFDAARVAAVVKSKRTEVKRVLLNQEVVSGIGNIYADEALWAARIHPRQLAARVSVSRLAELLGCARDVMARALDQGGTSFDSLYVNVNGSSGYFSRSLNAYGRSGGPCRRCGTPLVKESFMNRSSHLCPTCQRRY
ncbi:hypothetical protein CATYP_03850 [Corynebacterium atypicum]|uniref:Formamidopyrimidine-DNA glycosylase n=1 Tax=Corynebacterium atypicum TaxID=191610 RepID=A0ABN4DCK6_9CORY|nr:bifunctional DNA-formamidopyrimidine glycosylase/DNA-(apurinic or apyrimidinic site) lyase [Corynebacterium atypicum]AIG63928.1 hypothetical protein CATYP_03850 [Corynebacterium atypicum]